MKVRSYFAIVRAEKGGLLLGGNPTHVSSRFATEEDARAWMDQCVEENEGASRKVGFACTYASEQVAEVPA